MTPMFMTISGVLSVHSFRVQSCHTPPPCRLAASLCCERLALGTSWPTWVGVGVGVGLLAHRGQHVAVCEGLVLDALCPLAGPASA
jgi:hypothetical protein